MTPLRVTEIADVAMRGAVCAGEQSFVEDAIRKAVAEEREACAKICEERACGWAITATSEVVRAHGGSEVVEAHRVEAHNIAAALRGRE